MLTRDKKNLEVAWYLTWRIDQVDRFLKSVRTIPDASARLEDMAASVIAAELGGHDLADLVRIGKAVGHRGHDGRGDPADRRAGGPGVRRRGERLPAQAAELSRGSAVGRLRADPQRAAQGRGDDAGRGGESSPDHPECAPTCERARLIAEAQADAARLVGQGEAEAARIANAAQAADPAFYQFLKTLETYRTALDQKTTLVLSVESPFFKLLTQGVPDLQPGSKDKPPRSPGPEETTAGGGR